MILYVLLAGFLPFEERTIAALFSKIKAADYSYPSWITEEAKSLLDGILVSNPANRLTLQEIYDHKWTRGPTSNPKKEGSPPTHITGTLTDIDIPSDDESSNAITSGHHKNKITSQPTSATTQPPVVTTSTTSVPTNKAPTPSQSAPTSPEKPSIKAVETSNPTNTNTSPTKGAGTSGTIATNGTTNTAATNENKPNSHPIPDSVETTENLHPKAGCCVIA